jgi:hypothetical protein
MLALLVVAVLTIPAICGSISIGVEKKDMQVKAAKKNEII